jgi:hypothetical protein
MHSTDWTINRFIGRIAAGVLYVSVMLIAASCGGGGDGAPSGGGGGDTPPAGGTAPTLLSIVIMPSNPSIAAGSSVQFTATGTYSDGSSQDITGSATWSSSDTTVVTVSSTGLATAKAAGTSTFAATMGGISGRTTMTVTARNVALESPFGFHPASVAKQGYSNNGYGDAQNIGVKWTRQGIYAFWFLVQPDLNKAEYDFSKYDQQWSAVPAGMHILANIAPQGPIDEGRCLPGSYFPVDEQKYIAFVKAVVQRYGGDLYAAAGLAAPIKFWQVGNEPNTAKSGFADLQRITYRAIKETCPDCTVLIGGTPGMPPVNQYLASFDKQYKPILDALGGNYVDVMDFHWYGNATGDYKGAKDVYNHIRSALSAGGFPGIPFWIAEMGSYSGDPAPVPISNPPIDYPLQTERQQALDYIKRFIYPLSFGVKKIFPAFGLMEGFKYDGGYFDYTGLIYDGWGAGDLGLGVKKLSYYTYKKMTEMLEGSDWNNIQTVQESADTYVYKFLRDGKPVYVAWWDYFSDPAYVPGKTKQVAMAGIQGNAVLITEAVPKFPSGIGVNNYSTAFWTGTVAVSNGQATIPLGDSPVFVEVLQ